MDARRDLKIAPLSKEDPPAAYPRFDLGSLVLDRGQCRFGSQGGPKGCISKLNTADNKKIAPKVLDTIENSVYTIVVSMDLNHDRTEAMMNFTELKSWMNRQITVNNRLKAVCLWYLLFLMLSVRKHSLTAAAEFSGLQTSQYSRLLNSHPDVPIYQLDQLSKKQARQFSSAMEQLCAGQLPWKVAVLIDATIQHRSSLDSDNVKRFNHGKGFQIGHQWTNIVLLINDKLIPLTPIPFYSKSYCREQQITYETENTLVVEYISNLDLTDYIGRHQAKHVVVLADSGYDDRKIENAIIKKKWHFIIALNKNRSVKSRNTHLSTPKSKGWSEVAQFFKDHRRVKWQTILLPKNRSRKKRMEFRTRQTKAYLRHVGYVLLVCSEFKKRPGGRRKYLACSDLKATTRQIVIGYRMRWEIEIFHKEIKMFLGFEDVATKNFASVIAHVHWVYCAYILLNAGPFHTQVRAIAEKQRQIGKIVSNGERSRAIQILTQFDGPKRYKTELQQAIADT